MNNKAFHRHLAYMETQKKARKFGHPSLAGAKPDWSMTGSSSFLLSS